MRFFEERLPGMPPIDARHVEAAIGTEGRWSRDNEWRISTVTTTEIARTSNPERYLRYRIRVECSFVFEAHSPTLTRAIEVAARFERLAQELWREIGWPTWATRDELDPPEGAV